MNLNNELIERIRKLESTIIITNDNEVIIDENKFGVITLVDNFRFTDSEIVLYDKLIGSGAAYLIRELNVSNVFAMVITKKAYEILSAHCNIVYDKMVDNILNRDKSDLCPIEKIAANYANTDALYTELKAFYTSRGLL